MKRTTTPGFGRPTEDLYGQLQGLFLTGKIAWHQAHADPDRAEEILAEWAQGVKHVTTIACLHLRAAAEQALARGNAADKATEVAEARIRNGLQVLATSLLDDGFNPHGFYVYCLWGYGDDDKPLYVGQSTNILSRLGSHLGDRRKRHRVRRVSLIACKTERQMNTTEMRLIKQYQPEWNFVGIEHPTRPRTKVAA